MTINETKLEKLQEFLTSQSLDIDFKSFFSGKAWEGVNDFDLLTDALKDDNYFDVEIIYYSIAMEYLKEYDNSLKESLTIASEYGFKPENLNSETLASLLASRNLENDWYDLKNKIEDFITELEEETEEE